MPLTEPMLMIRAPGPRRARRLEQGKQELGGVEDALHVEVEHPGPDPESCSASGAPQVAPALLTNTSSESHLPATHSASSRHPSSVERSEVTPAQEPSADSSSTVASTASCLSRGHDHLRAPGDETSGDHASDAAGATGDDHPVSGHREEVPRGRAPPGVGSCFSACFGAHTVLRAGRPFVPVPGTREAPAPCPSAKIHRWARPLDAGSSRHSGSGPQRQPQRAATAAPIWPPRRTGLPPRDALPAVGGAGRAPDPGIGADPFTLGVASGDPLPDAVMLWTRLVPEPGVLRRRHAGRRRRRALGGSGRRLVRNGGVDRRSLRLPRSGPTR